MQIEAELEHKSRRLLFNKNSKSAQFQTLHQIIYYISSALTSLINWTNIYYGTNQILVHYSIFCWQKYEVNLITES